MRKIVHCGSKDIRKEVANHSCNPWSLRYFSDKDNHKAGVTCRSCETSFVVDYKYSGLALIAIMVAMKDLTDFDKCSVIKTKREIHNYCLLNDQVNDDLGIRYETDLSQTAFSWNDSRREAVLSCGSPEIIVNMFEVDKYDVDLDRLERIFFALAKAACDNANSDIVIRPYEFKECLLDESAKFFNWSCEEPKPYITLTFNLVFSPQTYASLAYRGLLMDLPFFKSDGTRCPNEIGYIQEFEGLCRTRINISDLVDDDVVYFMHDPSYLGALTIRGNQRGMFMTGKEAISRIRFNKK